MLDPETSAPKAQAPGDAAEAGPAVRLSPCFPWEDTARRAAWAFLLLGMLLFVPPRKSRYGPFLPLPPMQLWAARGYLLLGAAAVLLRLLVADELEVDPGSREVRRVRRLLLVREAVDSWAPDELAATSVRAQRIRFSYGGRHSSWAGSEAAIQGASTTYQPVLVTARQELVPLANPLSEDLVGANTLAEAMARRLGIAFVPGKVLETVRLRTREDQLEIAMEPAIEDEDWAPRIPGITLAAGVGFLLIELVARFL